MATHYQVLDTYHYSLCQHAACQRRILHAHGYAMGTVHGPRYRLCTHGLQVMQGNINSIFYFFCDSVYSILPNRKKPE